MNKPGLHFQLMLTVLKLDSWMYVSLYSYFVMHVLSFRAIIRVC